MPYPPLNYRKQRKCESREVQMTLAMAWYREVMDKLIVQCRVCELWFIDTPARAKKNIALCDEHRITEREIKQTEKRNASLRKKRARFDNTMSKACLVLREWLLQKKPLKQIKKDHPELWDPAYWRDSAWNLYKYRGADLPTGLEPEIIEWFGCRVRDPRLKGLDL